MLEGSNVTLHPEISASIFWLSSYVDGSDFSVSWIIPKIVLLSPKQKRLNTEALNTKLRVNETNICEK